MHNSPIPVGILGATGSVGLKFAELLSNHPWFEVKSLAASERSAGRRYGDLFKKKPSLPDSLLNLTVQKCEPNLPCEIVFSGLDASCAGEIEERFASEGYRVISNCRNHRMDPDVPLVIPEVNSDHLEILEKQVKGTLITNPNCSVVGLAMALKPLEMQFGIASVHVVTFQAISGAGFKGGKKLDINDNVIPFISGEEAKIERELPKVLGKLVNYQFEPTTFPISAHCNRVPVSDGHLQCVSITLKQKADEAEVIQAWESFPSLNLPSAPLQPLHYFKEEFYPQTKIHRDLEKGMAVSIGRLRKCSLFDYKFVLLSHNTIRGAAGGAILNAELLINRQPLSSHCRLSLSEMQPV